MSNVNNKVILVVGGLRGIGYCITRTLSAAGATVIGTSRNCPNGFSTVSDPQADGTFALNMDICIEDSVVSGVKSVVERFGRIDAVVCNAGIIDDGLTVGMSLQSWTSVITTNLTGSFLVAREVSKYMLTKRSGSIVNITSVASQSPNVGQSNYVASKCGIEGFTRALAMEIAPRGVRVNCVSPGVVATEMSREILANDQEGLLRSIPMRRLGTEKDIADAVFFLVSDQSMYITGSTINVDGGLSI